MKGLNPNRILAPVVVVVALGAVYGLATYGGFSRAAGSDLVQPPRNAPVTSVVRACLMPGQSGSGGANVALIALPATPGTGQAQVISAAGRQLSTLAHPGQLSLMQVRGATARPPTVRATGGQPIPTLASTGGVVVHATGSMARGLEVEQIAAGGVSAGRCENPSTDFWFVGPGQHTATRIQLFLMNTASQPADVNVEVTTDAGPLQGSTDTGIAVAPHSAVVQLLAPVLHGSRVIALHVRTSVGQVVAAVQEITGGRGSGAWLPAAGQPATQVVLPGLPSAAGTRQLFVDVPGTRDAHIRLMAITARGSYQPTGGSGLDIPGGSAVAILLPSLSGIPAAIQISSSVPVTATAMLAGGAAGAPGVFTAASLPVQEQGVVAYSRSGGGASSELVLSAPGRAVKAQITQVTATGAASSPQVVNIAAGHSFVVQLGKGGGSGHKSSVSVVITPLAGSGPLYAGQVTAGSGTGGTVESLMPVASALTVVPLPETRGTVITAVP